MEEENKKMKVTPIVIGVITLLVLVIGATYAYFAVGLSNNFGTTTISASAEDVGTVTLTNINSTLSMNLTAADMMRHTGFESCWREEADECNCAAGLSCPCETNPTFHNEPCTKGTPGCVCTAMFDDVTYYATPTGKSTEYNMTWEIGRATVTPNTDTNYYSCDYTLSITTSGTTNMYTAFNNMPEEANATQARPNAYKSRGQVIFQINDTEYDWFTDGMPSSYSGSLVASVDNPGHITAGLRMINKADIDQTDLAGTDVSISIQATSFSCVAVMPEFGYYNSSTQTSQAPGNMNYYIKETIANNTVVMKEACAVINNDTFCFKGNEYSDASSYYTQLSGSGATCTYNDNDGDHENDELVCSYNNVRVRMQNNFVEVADTSNNDYFCFIDHGFGDCSSVSKESNEQYQEAGNEAVDDKKDKAE